LDNTADAVPRCVALLGGSTPQVRQGAAFFLLGKFGAGRAEVDDALIAALTDDDAGVRHIALQAVNELQGDDVLPAIGQLARMLENAEEDKHIRAQIARRFGRMGPEAQEVVPTLERLGRSDPDRDVRASCLYAYYKIADRDKAITVFRKVLREEPDPGLRGVAATRLGSFGAAAATSVPDLATALDENKDPTLRGKVADALARIGPPALPALVERFQAPDREIRILAIFSAGRMGPIAASAAPQLQRLLDDPDRDVRLAAELSLRRLQGGP
jgi:HEAT repeat protein